MPDLFVQNRATSAHSMHRERQRQGGILIHETKRRYTAIVSCIATVLAFAAPARTAPPAPAADSTSVQLVWDQKSPCATA